MRIIAKKNNLYDIDAFLKNNEALDYVEGLYFNIATTKDNNIIIFDYVSNNTLDLVNVESQDLNKLNKTAVILLKTFLDNYSKVKKQKKIFLELLLSPNIFSHEVIGQYVSTVLNLVNQYPDISFYLCSNNQNVLNVLQKFDMEHKVGYVIYPSNYIDVDFYIFSVPLLNKEILTEQFKLKKDILIAINDWNELDYMNNVLGLKKVKDSTFCDQLCLIGEYPEIIYKALIENQKN